MNSALLRRLIFTFLTLSLVAGSVSLLWPQNKVLPEKTAQKSGEDLSANYTAFVENPGPVNEAAEQSAPVLDKNNLTDVLAKKLADQILAGNPSGPELGVDGGFSANAPDIQVLAEALIYDPEAADLVGQVSAQPPEPRKNFKVVQKYKDGDLGEYIEALAAIGNQYVSDPRLNQLPEGDSSQEVLNAARLALAEMIKDLEELPVPQPLLPLHESAWRMFSGAKEVLSLGGKVDDPARNYLALQRLSIEAETAVLAFQEEFQRINLVQSVSQSDDSGKSLSLPNIFGIQTASAQLASVPITVLMETAPTVVSRTITIKASWVQKLFEWGREIGTEILKERLLKRMVSQTIAWVQGGGNPQFVTNWRSFLRDAGNVAAGDVLYKINPKLCQPFQPLFRVAFAPVNLPPEAPIVCTLDQVVQNIQGFYDDFNNGGWIAYGASLRPENNFWGAFIQTSDIVAREAAEAREAARNEAIAGQGFARTTSTSACVKSEIRQPADGVGPPYKACLEWKITTPGSVVGQVVASALSSPIDRIVNADDLEALAGAFIDSALNKLFTAGHFGLLGRGVASETPGSGGQNPAQCAGLSGEAYEQCRAIAIETCNALPSPEDIYCLESIAEPGGGEEPASLLSDLKTERAKYGTPMTAAELGKLLNAVAWKNKDSGWVLLGKAGGNNCPSPGGAPISCDYLVHQPTMYGYDVLSDSENTAKPTWDGPDTGIAAMVASGSRTLVQPVQP